MVQAHDSSQACSIGMSFSKRASQIDVPAGTSMTEPSGQYSSWGRITICVMVYSFHSISVKFFPVSARRILAFILLAANSSVTSERVVIPTRSSSTAAELAMSCRN